MINLLKNITFSVALLSAVASHQALANSQIRVVGSSTVYPFTTVAAEHFGRNTGGSTPIIESTGTGGGFKLFCAGAGEGFPDMTNASRAIKESETGLCAHTKVGSITEIKIGYDGIVLANAAGSKHFNVTKEEIFSALAKSVVKDGKLIANPNKTWNQINPALPAEKIEVYGPPPTSGTRDAFVELVMEPACVANDAFKKAYANEEERKKACHMIREDGYYIESGENDNLIVQKLKNNPNALGVFGYSFLDQNHDSIQGAHINGVQPTFDAIIDGSYPVSRPLFVYLKDAHLKQTKGLKEFVKELISDKAISEDGYLVQKGLIPLTDEERLKLQQDVMVKIGK